LRRPAAPSHGVSWRSEDSDPTGIGRTWVPSDPHGVSTPTGFTPDRTCDQPKPIAALLALSRPFRGPSPQPRTGPRGPWGRRPMLPLLSFLALRHDLEAVDPFSDDGSLRRPVPRPGFGYPLRGVHHHPYRRAKRRSTHGLLPSRSLPVAAVPLSRPLPSCRFRSAPTRRSGPVTADAFRALFSRRSRDPTLAGPIHEPPWGSPLQSLPSRRPGARFVSRCRPSHPWAGTRFFPPGSQGSAERRDRLIPLGTAGSPGVSHLPTVTALRSPSPGAGSWFRLARVRAYARPTL
jgi:hypothetical protein